MNYPLKIQFKTIALAPQIFLTDANKQPVAYIRQKIFRFREHVEVFTDKKKSGILANINADKVIDWSARYTFTDADGNLIGSMGRKGTKSLWKATYTVFKPSSEEVIYTIQEENPFAKVFDTLLGEIPVISYLTALLFQPRYAATLHSSGHKVMRLTKKAAFFEGRFQLDKLEDIASEDELSLLLSFQMLTLLERARG